MMKKKSQINNNVNASCKDFNNNKSELIEFVYIYRNFKSDLN